MPAAPRLPDDDETLGEREEARTNLVTQQGPGGEEVEDIDPSDWLSQDRAAITERFVLPNGKGIKIAPITDAEEFRIQQQSKRPDPQDPRRKVREFTIYKRMFIAASINKAYGADPGSPHYVDERRLANLYVGELTNLMTAIMKLSGMDTDAPATNTGFFA